MGTSSVTIRVTIELATGKGQQSCSRHTASEVKKRNLAVD